MVNAARNGSHFEAEFGPLELRVLETLWIRAEPACVRDIQPMFPGVAYTTLMTTLDRLFRKRILAREKTGRAYFYQAAWTRDQLQSQLAGSALARFLPGELSTVRPILSMFVDEVGRRDRGLLDELEALVRDRRDALEKEKETP
ncbi:MAG: BlaI/MecI/CopY family transcriptional regulator [Vicinamibacterales bacterium]